MSIHSFLVKDKNNVTIIDKKIFKKTIINKKYDFLISYGYRYLIDSELINFFNGNAINLHISYLPWNKGSDPNLWSFLEDTPKGVTIHKLDDELDTGDIICQKKIFFNDNHTLKSSYEILQNEMVKIFINNWEGIKFNKILTKKQVGRGSFHKQIDKNIYQNFLLEGWETKIKNIKGKALND
jgi:methionyl-tRNA formyltransferase